MCVCQDDWADIAFIFSSVYISIWDIATLTPAFLSIFDADRIQVSACVNSEPLLALLGGPALYVFVLGLELHLWRSVPLFLHAFQGKTWSNTHNNLTVKFLSSHVLNSGKNYS